MATMYKKLVAAHFQALSDAGYTQLEMARMIGTERGNFISMVMNLDRPERLPIKRLPALDRVRKLDPREAVHLFLLHAREYPEGGELDEGAARWFMEKSVEAERLSSGGVHAAR